MLRDLRDLDERRRRVVGCFLDERRRPAIDLVRFELGGAFVYLFIPFVIYIFNQIAMLGKILIIVIIITTIRITHMKTYAYYTYYKYYFFDYRK